MIPNVLEFYSWYLHAFIFIATIMDCYKKLHNPSIEEISMTLQRGGGEQSKECLKFVQDVWRGGVLLISSIGGGMDLF